MTRCERLTIMHFYWEKESRGLTGCNINSLSWMGRVPSDLNEETSEWRLNRCAYYQDGWLASGNEHSTVGVTFTSISPSTSTSTAAAAAGGSSSVSRTDDCAGVATARRWFAAPRRTNYNLRGHRSQVTMVSWNEPYQKLATCDTAGIIFVWIKYESRWSIELINDRSTPVSHFSWSHDGRMALISYQDGFVLVGSVAGQRYWSSNLHLNSNIAWGTWTPNDAQVYFGCRDGCLVAMDVHGSMVSNVELMDGVAIVQLEWNCEKFKMEEKDDAEYYARDKQFVLAVSFETGVVYLMKELNDVNPTILRPELQQMHMQWCNSGQVLAVAGTKSPPEGSSGGSCWVYLYSSSGHLRYRAQVPTTSAARVTAVTWGHNDRRLFVACGRHVHVARVWPTRVATLESLCRLAVGRQLRSEPETKKLPIPPFLRHRLRAVFSATLRCDIPKGAALRRFVTHTPEGSRRFHCTMLCHDDVQSLNGVVFTLNMEFLGALVPILGARQTCKLRPQFVIFNFSPEIKFDLDDSEERITEDFKTFEKRALLQVSSNLWGTKFRLTGLSSLLPLDVGTITYRASMLHLQPRQMTLVVTDLSDTPQTPPAPQTPYPRSPPLIPPSPPPLTVGDNARTNASSEEIAPSSSTYCSDADTKTLGTSIKSSRRSFSNHPRLFRKDSELAASIARHEPAPVMRPANHTVAHSRQTHSSAFAVPTDVPEQNEHIVAPTRRAPGRSLSMFTIGHGSASLDIVEAPSTSLPPPIVLVRPGIHKNSTKQRPTKSRSMGAMALRDSLKQRQRLTRTPTSHRHHTRCLENNTRGLHDTVDAEESVNETDEPEDKGDCRPCFDQSSPTIVHATNSVYNQSHRPAPMQVSSHCGSLLCSMDEEPRRRRPTPGAGKSARLRQPPSCISREHSSSAAVGVAFDSSRNCLSSPNTPMMRRKCTRNPSSSPIRQRLLNSPLLCRRAVRSSDEDDSPDDEQQPQAFVNSPLATHSVNSAGSTAAVTVGTGNAAASAGTPGGGGCGGARSEKPQRSVGKNKIAGTCVRMERCRVSLQQDRRQLVMHNIAPLWNEASQVYQLDFGGRVTQESAKNFQIQYCGEQVLQFGRIDTDAYTLDFQYPFTAVQAFAVALANITQRFK